MSDVVADLWTPPNNGDLSLAGTADELIRSSLAQSDEFLAAPPDRTLLKRWPTLADVAEAAAFIASDRAAATTGTVINLTAGSVVN